MSLLDLLRQEYVTGRVLDKYNLADGNIGLVLEDSASSKRYHVEFKDRYRGPGIENLYGLLKFPFDQKIEQVDKLINKGDQVGLTLSYSRGPIREAYHIHSVSRPQLKKIYNRNRVSYAYTARPYSEPRRQPQRPQLQPTRRILQLPYSCQPRY